MSKALGLLEFSSIAKGMEATDAMTKAAAVILEDAKTICPGKYMAIVSGDVAAVSSAISAGRDVGGSMIVNELVIPSVHEELCPAMQGTSEVYKRGPVGILEFFSVASAVVAADTAAKTADVKLMDVRLAMAIGGKSYVTMTGELASVTAAVEAAAEAAGGARGMLIHKTVIASPTEEFFRKLI
ncbi:BMC domain-containing protein [Parendozoicomonas haliclonae]|uniref:BMC domain-containing protein n=1 Tax=Parendozoicomonas haliclonae TaxID=1960125 RepID=A0A1X7ALM5_9GAMM|nr:BMC domain-containing protein [Parendozoicomonas haliclonae]SMA48864.1 hypothetical protein EHSB41UT_02939 [Parendozoicomonas haliclonae]